MEEDAIHPPEYTSRSGSKEGLEKLVAEIFSEEDMKYLRETAKAFELHQRNQRIAMVRTTCEAASLCVAQLTIEEDAEAKRLLILAVLCGVAMLSLEAEQYLGDIPDPQITPEIRAAISVLAAVKPKP